MATASFQTIRTRRRPGSRARIESMAKTTLVVPCYNEAARLRPDAFERHLAACADTRLLFVNDGSTDQTLDVLGKIEAAYPDRVGVVDVQPNRGKAEAVRQGMLAAFEEGPDYAGFWDADLATPLDELADFVALLDAKPEIEIVIGSRVNLLGRSIERSPLRHYLGRVFATVVSTVLGLSIYDTQCGAKIFRVSPTTEALFREPFGTRWVFDVELLARLIRDRRGSNRAPASKVVYEMPLRVWQDVAGSKLRATDFLKAIGEVASIYRRYLSPTAAR